MPTIGRHWPSSAPRGDYAACCDICGVRWRRSELRRDRAGRLVCPDEGDGKDEVALAEESARNSAAAAARASRPRSNSGGGFDRSPTETPPPLPPLPVGWGRVVTQ